MSSPRRLRHLPALLSLALHAGLVLLALWLGATPPEKRAAVETIELELFAARPATRDEPPAAPQPIATPPPVAAPKKKPAKPKVERRAKPEVPRQEPESKKALADSASTPRADPVSIRPAMKGAPLAFSKPEHQAASGGLVLTPSSRVAEQHGIGSTTGPVAGTTVRPGDPSPDRGYLAAQEARTVEGRIEGMLQDVLAHDRVDKGLVDDYFVELKNAFEERASEPPQIEQVKNPVSAAITSYIGGMERYGATGNPYAEQTDARHSDPGSPGALRTDDPVVQSRQQALNRYQDFVDGKFAKGIVAIVEVKQARDGRLLDAQLLKSSGQVEFDDHAMKSVPDAIATLPAPTGGGGIHDWGIHSVWAFEGKIVYAQPVEGASDAMYLVFGGSFDETTGTVYVNKLDKPKFVCKVRLLKVY